MELDTFKIIGFIFVFLASVVAVSLFNNDV